MIDFKILYAIKKILKNSEGCLTICCQEINEILNIAVLKKVALVNPGAKWRWKKRRFLIANVKTFLFAGRL